MAVRLGIDTGGTFTDLIGIDDVTGELVVAKTPSTPSRPVDAIMNAIAQSETEADALEAISIGTTVATNALLQRNGATVIYVTTAGFRGHPLHPAHEPQTSLLAEVDQAAAARRATQLPRGRGAARFPRPDAHPPHR